MDRSDLEDWLTRYRTAWKSDDPDQIAALFVDDASYSPWPFSSAWEGRPQIVRKWVDRGDSKRPWEFEHEILAYEGAVSASLEKQIGRLGEVPDGGESPELAIDAAAGLTLAIHSIPSCVAIFTSESNAACWSDGYGSRQRVR